MKVGFVIPHLHGGGAEYVTRTWIRELDARGHDVRVYTYDERRDQQPLPARAIRRHFPLRGAFAKSAVLPFWLRRQVVGDGVEVLVCMMTFTNLIGIISLKLINRSAVRVLISERNMPSVLLPRFGTSGRTQLRLARLLYRRADAAIAISHPVAGDLVGGFRVRSARTFVVPNPVLARGEEPTATGPDRVILGYVGRLVAQKRPALFIAVLEELASRAISVEGVVIGDGPLRQAIEGLARASGVTIRFIGWVEPWTERAGAFDCLLLPSVVEGFGNVLVEAAASGVPCVASSLAFGVADAIIPGLTGELALDDSPTAFADAVLRALAVTSPNAPMGPWLSRFSTKQSVDALEQVLTKINARPFSHQ